MTLPADGTLRRVSISGLGANVPERVLSNHDLEKMVDTSDEWITQRTGIKERRLAAPTETTTDLAVTACRRALDAAGLSAEDLDGVILCTVTPDTFLPAGACYIQDRLGAKKAFAFDLLAACTGFVYGLVTARSFIASGAYDHILVVGAETLSRILDFTDRNTCILFGDGAGAAVVSHADALPESARGGDLIDFELRSDGSGADLILLPGGGSKVPPTHQSVDEKQHFIRLEGREVFKFAVSKMTEMVTAALERNNLTAEDIRLVVPHQVNYRIIEASLRKLDIALERVYINLDRYGNTSAASVPIALDEAIRLGKVERGDLILLVAFGGGLTWGYALWRW